MPVFMKDVAERAAVSLTTASLVLSGKKGISISAETRRRVIEAAHELNYHPNENARRLAQRTSNTFGLIVSEIANPFFPEIIQSFESAARARGFDLLLCNTEYDWDRSAAAVRKMIDNKVRGVAVVTSKFERSLIRELVTQRIPVVVLHSGLIERGTGSVVIDYAQGLDQAIEHLRGLGHRTFAAITGPHSVPSAVRYQETLVRLLAARGLHLQTVLECNYRLEGGMEAIRSLVKQGVLPTAILCGNDLIALGAISVLEQLGVRVPEDVSVVGFDDIVFARLATPPLTTVTVPRETLGRTAFEALHALQRAKTRKAAHHTIGTQLIVRASTAQARAHDTLARTRRLNSRSAASR
jgi:LacI family transcriptional regulator